MNSDWQSFEVARRLVFAQPRGRWVAVCRVAGIDGKMQVRGRRFTSKSRARRFARGYHGVVRRYRSSQWLEQPRPTVMVQTWVYHTKPENQEWCK